MTGMHLAIRLPYHTEDASGETMSRIAGQADAAGLHSGWVADHIVFPAGETASRTPTTSDGRYPRPFDENTLEAWTSLAYVAGATKRLRLGVGVCVLPYRNPVILAKQIATLDRLSGGRVLCGVGLGWLQEEFAALGVPYRRRRRLFLESVELMRACWNSSPVSFQGREFSTNGPVHFVPRPTGRIPLLGGGHADVALERAATMFEGWVGHELLPDAAAKVRARLREAAGGRLPDDYTVVMSRLINVPGVGEQQPGKFDASSPTVLADELARYEEAGVDVLLCESTVRTSDALARLLDVVHAAGSMLSMVEA
jgi:probable F420-dependent oxidoreductase